MAEASWRMNEALTAVSDPAVFQRRVLSLALSRAVECLGVPSARVRELCDELGISRRALWRAVRYRQVNAFCDGSEKEVNAEKYKDEETRSTDGLFTLLLQDMILAFFTKETLNCEQSPEGAMAGHESLWRKVVELKEARDETLQRAMLTPEQQRLVTALVEALEEQARDEQDSSPFMEMERDILYGAQRFPVVARDPDAGPLSVSLFLAKSKAMAGSQGFGIPPLTAGYQQSSSPIIPTSPTPQHGRRSVTAPTLFSPKGGHRHQSRLPEESICLRHGNSGGGDLGDSFHERSEHPNVTLRQAVGKKGAVIFANSGGARFACTDHEEKSELNRLKKEIVGLRGQRDVLARSFSFVREQYSDALSEKSKKIEPVQRKEVETLQRASNALRVELAAEKRRRAEDVARLEGEAARLVREADRAARRAEDAERARATAHARLVEKDAVDTGMSEALEHRALALEKRSTATAAKNERLRGRLDAALGDVEEMLQSNKDLSAELDAARSSQEALISQKALIEEAVTEKERLAGELTDAKAQISALESDLLSLCKANCAADADALRRSLESGAPATAEAVDTNYGVVKEVEKEKADTKAAARKREGENRLVDEFDWSVDTTRGRLIEAVAPAEDWVARSRKWEDDATRLADALRKSEEETARAREELKTVVVEVAEDLAKARGEVARMSRVRKEEAATARKTEAGLRDELKTAQATALALQDVTLKSGASAARVSVGEKPEARYAPTATYLPRIVREDAQRDSARKSLLKLARLRGVLPAPNIHDGDWEEGESCSDGEGARGDEGVPKGGTSVGGEIGGFEGRELDSGSRMKDGIGRRSAVTRGSAGLREIDFHGGRDPCRADEVTTERSPSESKEEVAPDNSRKTSCPVDARGAGKASVAVEGGGGGFGQGKGQSEDEQACRVRGGGGNSTPVNRRLSNRQLILSRATPEVVETADAVAEDATTSSLERRETEVSLEESAHEQDSTVVEEGEKRAKREADKALAEVVALEALLLDARGDLARERAAASARQMQVPSQVGAVELERVKATLRDCRAELVDRSRELDALRSRDEASQQKVADTHEANETTCSVGAIVRTLKGTGGAVCRWGKEETEDSRRAQEQEHATVETEEARARQDADGEVLVQERDALREKCASLESRLAEIEVRQRSKHAAKKTGAATTAAVFSVARRERPECMETTSTPDEEVAMLQSRLCLTGKRIATVRRETLVEEHARLLDEVDAMRKKAAEASTEAASLRRRCGQHEAAIVELAYSREEEAEACRSARTALVKERSVLAKSVRRVQELELELVCLSSQQQHQKQQHTSPEKGKPIISLPTDVESASTRNRHDHRASTESVPWATSDGDEGFADNSAELSSSVTTERKSRVGPREAREREKTHNAVFALEESLNAAKKESEQLKERLSWVQARLREKERRANEMKAEAASARATVDRVTAEMEMATLKAEAAMARTHVAEQKATTAKDLEVERAAAREVEVLRMTNDLREAREGRAEARGEVSRLRHALEDSDRRSAGLERKLSLSTASLRGVEDEPACALINLIEEMGEEAPRPSEGDEILSISPARENSQPMGMGSKASLANGKSFVKAFGISNLPSSPTDAADEGDTLSYKSRVVLASNGYHETTEGCERLTASQAHHQELMRVSGKAITERRENCEEGTRAAVAASTLSAACCRWHGISLGQDLTTEAAARLALMRRSFRALRVEALLRSRDRSVRRLERLQLWVVQAVDKAGEELVPHIRRRSEGEDRALARPTTSETYAFASSEINGSNSGLPV